MSRPRRSGGRDKNSDIPFAGPGTALVFQLGNRFVPVPSVDFADPGRYPAGVTAAVVVSLQSEMVAATTTMPSSREGVLFGVTALFDCRVTDAGLLLQFGCWEALPWLCRYVDEDAVPRTIAAGTDPARVGALAVRLAGRARTRGRISPPFIAGMTCALLDTTIDVRTAREPETTPVPSAPPRQRSAGPAPQDYVWEE